MQFGNIDALLLPQKMQPTRAYARCVSLGPGTLTRMYAALWNQLSKLPKGRWLFSRLVGQKIPYTGSLKAVVLEAEPGFARVELRDRKAVRNHLDCVHAAALMNLAEFASGFALVIGVPDSARAILTSFRIEYLKKARGTLVAESRCEMPDFTKDNELELQAVIKNAQDEVVCRAFATWKVGPRK